MRKLRCKRRWGRPQVEGFETENAGRREKAGGGWDEGKKEYAQKHPRLLRPPQRRPHGCELKGPTPPRGEEISQKKKRPPDKGTKSTSMALQPKAEKRRRINES